MPTKSSANGKQYDVKDGVFSWTTDEGATVRIPMRLKLGVIRKLAGKDLDATVMFQIIDAVAPGQEDVLDEQDVNDFQSMFTTWQREYNALNGATPGE